MYVYIISSVLVNIYIYLCINSVIIYTNSILVNSNFKYTLCIMITYHI